MACRTRTQFWLVYLHLTSNRQTILTWVFIYLFFSFKKLNRQFGMGLSWWLFSLCFLCWPQWGACADPHSSLYSMKSCRYQTGSSESVVDVEERASVWRWDSAPRCVSPKQSGGGCFPSLICVNVQRGSGETGEEHKRTFGILAEVCEPLFAES